MDEDQKKWLAENFKAGEFVQLTMLLRLEDISRFKEMLEEAGIKSVMMPQVAEGLDFQEAFADTSDKDSNPLN